MAARTDGYGNDLVAAITAAASSLFLTQTLTAARLISGATYVLEAAFGIASPAALYRLHFLCQFAVGGTTYNSGWGNQAQAAGAGASLVAIRSGVVRSRPFVVPGTVTSASLVIRSFRTTAQPQPRHSHTRSTRARAEAPGPRHRPSPQ